MLIQSNSIDALRSELRVRFPEVPGVGVEGAGCSRISTGVRAVDRVLGGGLMPGRVSAWVGQAGSGVLSILRQMVIAWTGQGRRVAVVDGTLTMDPVDWAGIASDDLLWFVRPKGGEHALWAAELLARSGGFSLVAVDVSAVPFANRRRQGAHLRRAVREGGGALLLMGDAALSMGCSMQTLRVESSRMAWDTGRRRLILTLVRGGEKRKAEVECEAQQRFVSYRLPAHAPTADRRSRQTRSR